VFKPTTIRNRNEINIFHTVREFDMKNICRGDLYNSLLTKSIVTGIFIYRKTFPNARGSAQQKPIGGDKIVLPRQDEKEIWCAVVYKNRSPAGPRRERARSHTHPRTRGRRIAVPSFGRRSVRRARGSR
jgi:hypothetical protein